MHFHNMDDLNMVTGLGFVAHAAAQWAGRLHAWRHDAEPDTEGLPTAEQALGIRDTETLQIDDEPGGRAIWKEALAIKAMQATTNQKDSRTAELGGHLLAKAAVEHPGEGQAMFCSKCGGYSWRQHSALLYECPGPVPGRKTQRDR